MYPFVFLIFLSLTQGGDEAPVEHPVGEGARDRIPLQGKGSSVRRQWLFFFIFECK